jgi:hypothetical protein
MSRSRENITFALDPVRRGFAFVVLHGERLLDWGTHGLKQRAPVTAEAAVEFAISLGAELLVIEDAADVSCRRRRHVKQFLRGIATVARHEGLAVSLVKRHEVRVTWQEHGLTRKEAVAPALAERYPELQPIVPPPRKTWMPEDARVNVFDALTLALAVRERQGDTRCLSAAP